jgi:hypothetical protein
MQGTSPYTFAEHVRRHEHYPPSGRLRAFWQLPEHRQAEACAELRRAVETSRELEEASS